MLGCSTSGQAEDVPNDLLQSKDAVLAMHLVHEFFVLKVKWEDGKL